MKITADTLISEILECTNNVEAVVEILQSTGMHCLGCAMRHRETLAQAAEMHCADIDKLVEEINKYC